MSEDTIIKELRRLTRKLDKRGPEIQRFATRQQARYWSKLKPLDAGPGRTVSVRRLPWLGCWARVVTQGEQSFAVNYDGTWTALYWPEHRNAEIVKAFAEEGITAQIGADWINLSKPGINIEFEGDMGMPSLALAATYVIRGANRFLTYEFDFVDDAGFLDFVADCKVLLRKTRIAQRLLDSDTVYDNG